MNTLERLAGYYPFSIETREAVSDFADKQARYRTYQDFFDEVGVGQPYVVEQTGYKPVSVLDIRPDEHDPAEALFYHLPMANPLDANQMYQVATIAGTNPGKRVIAAGNPSAPGYGAGRLTHSQRAAVTRGDLTPTVDPVLRFADEQGIEFAEHVGYSYGSDKAAEAATRANHEVKNIVAIEPVVGARNLLKLGLDFAATAKHLKRYVEANELPSFNEARQDSVGPLAYNLGLLRLTNIAIARALGRGDFDSRVMAAMDQSRQENAVATIIWGSASELARDGLCKALYSTLEQTYGSRRVQRIRLEDQTHALANDVHLQAAVVLDALSGLAI